MAVQHLKTSTEMGSTISSLALKAREALMEFRDHKGLKEKAAQQEKKGQSDQWGQRGLSVLTDQLGQRDLKGLSVLMDHEDKRAQMAARVQ